MTRVNLTIDPAALCDQHLMAETREIGRLVHNYANRKSIPPSKFTLGAGHVLFCTQLLTHCKNRFHALQNEMAKRGFTSNLTWNDIDHPRDISFTNVNEAHEMLLERILLRYPKNARYYSKQISKEDYEILLRNSQIRMY